MEFNPSFSMLYLQNFHLTLLFLNAKSAKIFLTTNCFKVRKGALLSKDHKRL